MKPQNPDLEKILTDKFTRFLQEEGAQSEDATPDDEINRAYEDFFKKEISEIEAVG